MCLALPARLVERLHDDQAIVDLGGIRKPISIALVPWPAMTSGSSNGWTNVAPPARCSSAACANASE